MTFKGFIVSIAIILTIIVLFFASLNIISAALVGFGFVVGFAIVIHKFPLLRKLVYKLGRWFDLLVFILSFLLAGSMFGLTAAVFIGIYTSAYLAIYQDISRRKDGAIYQDISNRKYNMIIDNKSNMLPPNNSNK